MNKRNIGPGPGAYGLPTVVGFDGHDITKHRLPQYSFGARAVTIDKRVSPGPGAYKVEGMNRHGSTKTPEYTMGSRTPVKDKRVGPGPNAYDIHTKPFFKGSTAPAYSMAIKINPLKRPCIPGPNVYAVNVQTIKPGIPAFSMGIKTDVKAKPASPGPATYGGIDINLKLPRSPIYTMAPRSGFEPKNIGPGANAYNLAEHKPGRKGAAFSFGVKHSINAPPMIVECDNP